MKRSLLAFVLFLLADVAFAQLPAVDVENADGQKCSTEDLLKEGTPIVISFWSTTCKPCIHELDAMSEAFPEWKEDVSFRIVAVSVDDSRLAQKARSLAEGHDWGAFVLLFDKNQDFMRAMNVSLTPQVFVLDGKGDIVYSHTGYIDGSESEVFEAVKRVAAK